MPHARSMLALLVLTACSTTYQGLKAVAPGPPHGNVGPEVESLQPTLRWEPSQRKGVTYDLVVARIDKKTSFWKGTERSVGGEVYRREGLTAPEHRLEIPLEPDREYLWAVRERVGDTVGAWSSYSFFDFYVVAWRSGSDMAYRFRTPPAPRPVEAAAEAR